MTKYEYEVKIRELIKELAPAGTEFRWSKAKRTFGTCYYQWRNVGFCQRDYYGFRISISYPLASMNTWEEVKKCVLHEIAHANTPGHDHDRIWQEECIRIGGDGKRCYTDSNRGGAVNVPDAKWTGTCPVCNKVVVPRRLRRTNCYHPCVNNNQHLKIVWTAFAG